MPVAISYHVCVCCCVTLCCCPFFPLLRRPAAHTPLPGKFTTDIRAQRRGVGVPHWYHIGRKAGFLFRPSANDSASPTNFSTTPLQMTERPGLNCEKTTLTC